MICLLRRHYPLLLLAINTHTSCQLGGFTYSDHHSQVERTRRQRLRRSGASVTGESPAGVTIVTMIGTMCRSVTGGWIKWVRWGCQVPDNSVSPPATLHQHISWPNTMLLFTNNLEKYFWQKYLNGQSSIIFANRNCTPWPFLWIFWSSRWWLFIQTVSFLLIMTTSWQWIVIT